MNDLPTRMGDRKKQTHKDGRSKRSTHKDGRKESLRETPHVRFFRYPLVIFGRERTQGVRRAYAVVSSWRCWRFWHTSRFPSSSPGFSGCPRVAASPARQGHPTFLSGHPFFLKYDAYATSTSTSTGALRWIPQGKQGVFQSTPVKVDSFLGKEWPKACLF